MRQKEKFLESEGDAWFERNPNAGNDGESAIIALFEKLGLKPTSVLEIGCGGAGRLEHIRRRFQAECHGLDPSFKAITKATERYPELRLQVGTADTLPFDNASFDTVIFGCCLYLCDPDDHFRIAWQADRVLKDGGVMVIRDFAPPQPFQNVYVHADGLRSHKMSWTNMFLWHPSYSHLCRDYLEHNTPYTFHPNERVCTDLLIKNSTWAFPANPYR